MNPAQPYGMRVLGVLVFAAFTSLAAPAVGQDVMAASGAYRELQEICAEDRGRLWGLDLCGPTIIVDPTTRAAWASTGDNLGALRDTGAGWVGTLPPDAPLANTSVEWGGRRWIMLLAPLPEDETDRRVLLAHEAWHRIQPQLGLGAQRGDALHLDEERARVLLRLEFRALGTALRSRGRARQSAVRDALIFRAARHAAFADAAATETALDRNEGLAAYTGIKLGVHDNADLYAARIVDDFDSHDAYARAFAYASGPAYALILDRLDDDWRRTLGGSTPADMLLGIVEPRIGDSRELREATERYGGASITAEERARAEMRAAILAGIRQTYAQGPRLELPLISMRMEFNPNQITAIPNLGSYYVILTIRDAWGELRSTDGAVITTDFQRVIARHPDASGLAGPGWVLALNPGYQLVRPGSDGVWTIAPVSEPADAPR